MPGAFYERDGDGFVPTELKRGPWDPDAQHAGPPAGLIGRAVEACEGGEGSQVGRITFEILRAVPVSTLTVSAAVVRGGRRVELCEASLADADGEVIRATAWRMRRGEVALPREGVGAAGASPAGPSEGGPHPFFPTGQEVGYHTAMEYRFVFGSFREPGPAVVWMRMLQPLVQGEEPSPLQRVLVAADSGNGVSATLDWRRFPLINVDLTVHLHREPVGDWVCLDSRTLAERSGLGLSDTLLWDERGRIGRAGQTLLVAER